MLTGASLSSVQEFALDIMYFLDGQEQGQKELDEMRRTMLASGLRTPVELYPEFFPEQTTPDTGPVSPDVVYDMSGVKWESPSDKGIEEFERLQSLMRQHQYVTLTGDEEDLATINTQGFVLGPGDMEWI